MIGAMSLVKVGCAWANAGQNRLSRKYEVRSPKYERPSYLRLRTSYLRALWSSASMLG
jgi:hypothetical protein